MSITPTSPLYIMDGHSYLYKSFFAIKGLATKDGIPTNAVYGFVATLNKLLKEYNPQNIIITFDYPAKTFRSELYEEYKAHRPKMPDELSQQIPWIKKILSVMGIPYLEKEGYEADDLIGTISEIAQKKGLEVFIVSVDKDLFQLVKGNVYILYLQKDDIQILDKEKVGEKLKVSPEYVTDFLGLVGDTSDNIPGVPSIGPVTAVKLINQFGSLEAIFKHIDEISNEKLKALLIEHKEQAILSKRLATIDCQVPLDINIEKIHRNTPDENELAEILENCNSPHCTKRLM